MRDVVVATNIGVSTAATAGAAAASAVLAAKTTTTTATGGLWFKVLAGAVGVVVTGAAVTAVIALSGGGAGQTAVLTVTPMDEGIRDFEFVGAEFRSVDGRTTELITEQEVMEGNTGTATDIPYFVRGEPQYVDIDSDNDLDAAILISVVAGGSTPQLYVWLWEDGKAVQAKYPAAVTEDCGDHVEAFRPVVGALEVDLTTGARCEPDARLQSQTYRVTVVDGYPVRTTPGFGSVDTCDPAIRPVVGDWEGEPPLVAPATDAPGVAEAADIQRVELLSRQPHYAPDWQLARVTLTDGAQSCGWVRPG
ncbi:hypothetical protein LX16_2755 [Stackebrandtia albiflava]|uniref:Uncharacterized protein n=2 Tax=Stackebrandtia albiflava TaxID=406432 RepID=A0A562V275_9ACTN|nr:hypothetical protein LX16_2755 [Stackebrandtia albiflava]